MNKTSQNGQLWERIMDDMKKQDTLGEVAFKSFLSQLTLKSDTGTVLVFEYPSGMMIEWVENYYLDTMMASASRILDGARKIQFEEHGSAEAEVVEKEEEIAAAAPEPIKAQTKPRTTSKRRKTAKRKTYYNSGLNEDFRFDNFISGPNSEFACDVAKAVASGDASRFNPFFIYSESGLGKTHLLHAIGNEIREKNEELCVLYVTCEDFTNAYIDAIGSRREEKNEAIRAFRQKYRQADVLLIDDVQFLSNRQKTQDEFFHTFNTLYTAGKQIVMTSDRPAHEITDLDKRLSSRFEQGISVSINTPSFETRLSIVRNMRRKWKVDLVGDDVLEFLARSITRSVRSLEGALTRIASMASFSGRKPSVADARVYLRDILSDENGSRSTIEEIQRRVAEEFNIRVADINGRRRTANIARPRQVAMYLARRLTKKSLQDIGAAFGGRDHGTVIHAANTIEEKIEADHQLKEQVERLSALFA